MLGEINGRAMINFDFSFLNRKDMLSHGRSVLVNLLAFAV